LALPGGFVDVGESLAQAVVREAAEETGLRIQPSTLRFLGISDNPARDPRRQTVAMAWWGIAEPGKPQAADDVKEVAVHPLSSLPSLEMAFDHKNIVTKYLADKAAIAKAFPPSPAFVHSLEALHAAPHPPGY